MNKNITTIILENYRTRDIFGKSELVREHEKVLKSAGINLIRGVTGTITPSVNGCYFDYFIIGYVEGVRAERKKRKKK